MEPPPQYLSTTPQTEDDENTATPPPQPARHRPHIIATKSTALTHLTEALTLLRAALLEAQLAENTAARTHHAAHPTTTKAKAQDLRSLGNAVEHVEHALRETLRNELGFCYGERGEREALGWCLREMRREVEGGVEQGFDAEVMGMVRRRVEGQERRRRSRMVRKEVEVPGDWDWWGPSADEVLKFLPYIVGLLQ